MNKGEELIDWYIINKRDLPWRKTRDPYRVWLSEIILQQTRIAQGLSYYENITEKYPNVYLLAAAPEDEILKIWQGLGYYTRARNMLACARIICEKYNGKFPQSHKELICLPGIGTYTASAIASIAFNLKEVVMDGNAIRVFSRLFGINYLPQNIKQMQEYTQIGLEFMDQCSPAIFNQALMEFGALFCTPGKPDCLNCIFKKLCFAYNNDSVNIFPPKKHKIVLKHRFFHYFIFRLGDYTFIKQRIQNDIWKKLFEFPLIESLDEQIVLEENAVWFEMQEGLKIDSIKINATLLHTLTHQKIHLNFYEVDISFAQSDSYILLNYKKVETENLKKFAFPIPLYKMIEKSFDNETQRS